MWINAQNLTKPRGGCQFIDRWQVIQSGDVLKLINQITDTELSNFMFFLPCIVILLCNINKSFHLLDCLHKCMTNIPYTTACAYSLPDVEHTQKTPIIELKH